MSDMARATPRDPDDLEQEPQLLGASKAERHRSEHLARLVAQTERLTQTSLVLEERLVACQRTVDSLTRRAVVQRSRAPMQVANNGALAMSPAWDAGDETAVDVDGVVRLTSWQSDQRLLLGALEIFPVRQTVVNGGHTHRLTPTEWQLLAHLMAHPGEVLSRAQLATGAWGPGFASRASEVEVYISRLRKKLEWDGGRLIETVRGSGYRLTEAPQLGGGDGLS